MYRIGFCKQVEQEHRDDKRQYAHVFHIDNQVCVAQDFEKLPDRNRLGILMHEYGHILAGKYGSEEAANESVARETGIRIFYSSSRHGKHLEFIQPMDFGQARAILARGFK